MENVCVSGTKLVFEEKYWCLNAGECRFLMLMFDGEIFGAEVFEEIFGHLRKNVGA